MKPAISNNNNKRVRANEQIRVPDIRLIGEDGAQLGVMPTKQALEQAKTPNVKPPVCRIMDLGKYIYSLSKKEKEARKKQKVISVKEVKLTSKIEQHDYDTKLRNAKRFIERGDKVKLTLMFRGREITHKELGERVVAKFIEDMADVAEVERNDGLEGNQIHLYFAASAPVKKAVSKELPKEPPKELPKELPIEPPKEPPK